MSSNKNISNPVENNNSPEKESLKELFLKELLDLFGLEDISKYSVIFKQAFFILFIITIGIFHIYNSHKAVKMVREAANLEKEIKDLRWEHLSIKSDLLKQSMQSDIETRVQSIGLKSIKTPPYKIVVPPHEN
ncbi:MAG: hypothetical protein LC105_11795 [Chitinophagales bacterium]|nr:FtsL-like putative cell division protein [Chitinophagales bacterium]MCZ2394532.1 hypothetical protein [Chitinophagales bacterium]